MKKYWPFALLLVCLLGSILLWRSYLHEGLQEFKAFPHTFIAEADIGFDQDKVHVWTGDINSPKNVEVNGILVWPCFTSPDLPMQDGRPLLFPVIQEGDEPPHTPVLPGLGKALTLQQLQRASRFQTETGSAMLSTFAKEHGG